VAGGGSPIDSSRGRRQRSEERLIDEQHIDEGRPAERTAPDRAPVPPPYAPVHGRSTGPAEPEAEQEPAGQIAAGESPAGESPAQSGEPHAGPLAPPPLAWAGAPPAPPPAAEDGRAGWGWGMCLAGIAVGFGPEVLLSIAALGMGTSTSVTKVTVGSAIALVVASLVMYGWQTLTAWFFSLRVAGRKLALWGFTTPNKAFFWTIPAALAAVYVVSYLHDLVVHPKQQDIIGEFPRTTPGIILFVILAVVLAPLFEEIFFRGFLFRGFSSSWGWVTGACVSAAIFGIAHLQLDVFVPLFALGLALAWVYKRTGSLWTSIAFHALFNGLSVLAWALAG
jgi:membrane protease YdiL (CAAX protease family)